MLHGGTGKPCRDWRGVVTELLPTVLLVWQPYIYFWGRQYIVVCCEGSSKEILLGSQTTKGAVYLLEEVHGQ